MNWEKLAKNLLKGELKKRGIGYDELEKKLATINVVESAGNINRKINRGAFPFSFFLQCAVAIGIKNLRFEDIMQEEVNN